MGLGLGHLSVLLRTGIGGEVGEEKEEEEEELVDLKTNLNEDHWPTYTLKEDFD